MTIKIPDFSFQGSRMWKGVVIHHDSNVDGKRSDFERIKKFHTSWRYQGDIITEEKAKQLEKEGKKGIIPPWSDIAYNAVIEDENDEVVIKIGRGLNVVGAHAKEFNGTHLGIFIGGNFDVEVPSFGKWQAALCLTRNFMMKFYFSKDKVIGHRETFVMRNVPVEKSCPGKLWDMEKFRKELDCLQS